MPSQSLGGGYGPGLQATRQKPPRGQGQELPPRPQRHQPPAPAVSRIPSAGVPVRSFVSCGDDVSASATHDLARGVSLPRSAGLAAGIICPTAMTLFR